MKKMRLWWWDINPEHGYAFHEQEDRVNINKGKQKNMPREILFQAVAAP